MGARVGGEWKGGRKQRSLGASREERAEDVPVVRTGAPLPGAFLAPWGGRGRGPIPKTTRHGGPQPSADHGLHVCLPLKLVLDLVCTS